MRIIAGEFRGRLLREPKFDTTRPITDRAKQSLFDMLSPLIPDALVYDCFSGTGSMGLECLSRGARSVCFFDADRAALSGLRANVKALSVIERSQIVAGDIFNLLPAMPRTAPADLIFLDPPYRFLIDQAEAVRTLVAELATRMNIGATLVFRHDINDALDLPSFTCYRTRAYGSMMIELLRVANHESAA